MKLTRELKKEEKDVVKEEKWLLQEVQTLEQFQADIQEILQLEQRVKLLQRTAQAGNVQTLDRKLKLVQELIEQDENKFKRFRRILGRSERRRVRYENRALGHIANISASLDSVTAKDLNHLLEQAQVYSARILTELSWRVGKITELTSAKTPELAVIKNHLDATLQAAKALVALMEQLRKFTASMERKTQEVKLIQSQSLQTAGLTG